MEYMDRHSFLVAYVLILKLAELVVFLNLVLNKHSINRCLKLNRQSLNYSATFFLKELKKSYVIWVAYQVQRANIFFAIKIRRQILFSDLGYVLL